MQGPTCRHTHVCVHARPQETADAAPDTLLQTDPQAVVNSAHSAARQLGLHYLKRYFLLIVYRCACVQTCMCVCRGVCVCVCVCAGALHAHVYPEVSLVVPLAGLSLPASASLLPAQAPAAYGAFCSRGAHAPSCSPRQACPISSSCCTKAAVC